jgi:hypothetical protein
MGAGRLGLVITRLDKTTSLDLFHCREYGSISLRPVPVNRAGQEDSRWEDSCSIRSTYRTSGNSTRRLAVRVTATVSFTWNTSDDHYERAQGGKQ